MTNKKVKIDELTKEFQEVYTERTGDKINLKEARAILDDVLYVYEGYFEQGLDVPFGKFGNFALRERAARKGYNPKLLKDLKEQGVSDEEAKKQAEIDIDASNSYAFKPLKALKDIAKNLK